MISVLGVGAVCLTTSAAKVELGKLIKKLDPPKATKNTVEIKGDPSITKPDEKVNKGLIIVGKDGAFSVSTNTKVHSTQTVPVDVKLEDGQELVFKIKSVSNSTEPKGWLANFIGLDAGKKDYVLAVGTTSVYVGQTKPKWNSLGGHIAVSYPLTTQMRRLNGVLTFIVNGSPRVAVKVPEDAVLKPYFCIFAQKTASWGIVDISAMEIREINKAAMAKEPKPAKSY